MLDCKGWNQICPGHDHIPNQFSAWFITINDDDNEDDEDDKGEITAVMIIVQVVIIVTIIAYLPSSRTVLNDLHIFLHLILTML